MIKLVRTDSTNVDFIGLVKQLDAYLKITDGDEHDFYNQFNGLENINHVIVAYDNELAVGCGAFKPYTDSKAEIKRMYTKPEMRGKGIARKILDELEKWAMELGFEFTILETGKRQFEAVKFYQKSNYNSIPKYGQYKAMENSLCFEKQLIYEKR
ncbi:GNAT family N-acetyltransferase [Winogradskyella sp.]|uniref:GNAT family N-acetyltransferase n=1 Tax=Winogradskyella sp. TaxID=1883156 RepID=UPI003514B3E6